MDKMSLLGIAALVQMLARSPRVIGPREQPRVIPSAVTPEPEEPKEPPLPLKVRRKMLAKALREKAARPKLSFENRNKVTLGG